MRHGMSRMFVFCTGLVLLGAGTALAGADAQQPVNHYQAARDALLEGDTDAAATAAKLALQDNPLDASAFDKRAITVTPPIPEVKTIVRGRAWISFATCRRACSIASRASRPAPWIADGLPCRVSIQGCIDSPTRPSISVVALLSR